MLTMRAVRGWAHIHNDVQKIVNAGFQALPEGSGYAEIILKLR